MAEPQPSTIREGVDPTDETPATQPPASAEDRKAAAALSSLDSRNAEEEDSKAQTSKAKNIDQEALRRAISRLEVSSGEKVLGEVSERAKKVAEDKRKEKEAAERRRAVKVDQADVTLLVDELDLSKTKATDLLKAHEGDAVKAMKAFVTASV
ncbi:MAG: hypothetical protein Q9167_001219 [Letrouitia subvulpina]